MANTFYGNRASMLSKRTREMLGKRFGRWRVYDFVPPSGVVRHWRCQCVCDCGTARVLYVHQLRVGNTFSCGCVTPTLISASRTTHGKSRTRQYGIWGNMIERCCNPNNDAWHLYGGRGIAVCERWRQSYAAFLEDVGPRPSSKHSLDRINTNGNYEPGNVRWATMREQSNNRRNNKLFKFHDKLMTISEAVRMAGGVVPISTANSRVLKHRWRIELAVTTPKLLRTNGPNGEFIWYAPGDLP